MKSKFGVSVKDEVAAASKSLGKSAKMPPILDLVVKQADQAEDDLDQLMKLATHMTKTGDSVDKKLDTVNASLDKAIAAIGTENFGLDPKKPDDKKKIESARKDILKALNSYRKGFQGASDRYDDVSKTLVSAARGKGVA